MSVDPIELEIEFIFFRSLDLSSSLWLPATAVRDCNYEGNLR